ncbi:MAG: ATP synthase F1 subunit gamma [Eubacteriales bacterium]|nr:ATP synthase F1 subunit gamma [Eubacteriales bacterium]
MASMGDIKHSIRSISETEQITRAMHLISTSKMRKAISRYDSNHVHFERVQSALKDILAHSHELSHPYIGESEHGRAAYVVIAADKGLCGGYNHNVLNLAYDYMQQSEERYILTVGQEARAFFDRRGYMVDVEFLHVSQNPSLYNARNITQDILELYDNNIMDEVYVVYTQFASVLRQEPKVLKLLPLSVSNFENVDTGTQYSAEMYYHPSPREVFDILVPQYIIGLVYGCLVQSFASEHCARMTAMENATNNAEDMIDDLTKKYNRARQFAITNEISEIIGALEALS